MAIDWAVRMIICIYRYKGGKWMDTWDNIKETDNCEIGE